MGVDFVDRSEATSQTETTVKRFSQCDCKRPVIDPTTYVLPREVIVSILYCEACGGVKQHTIKKLPSAEDDEDDDDENGGDETSRSNPKNDDDLLDDGVRIERVFDGDKEKRLKRKEKTTEQLLNELHVLESHNKALKREKRKLRRRVKMSKDTPMPRNTNYTDMEYNETEDTMKQKDPSEENHADNIKEFIKLEYPSIAVIAIASFISAVTFGSGFLSSVGITLLILGIIVPALYFTDGGI